VGVKHSPWKSRADTRQGSLDTWAKGEDSLTGCERQVTSSRQSLSVTCVTVGCDIQKASPGRAGTSPADSGAATCAVHLRLLHENLAPRRWLASSSFSVKCKCFDPGCFSIRKRTPRSVAARLQAALAHRTSHVESRWPHSISTPVLLLVRPRYSPLPIHGGLGRLSGPEVLV